jgi:hypothetical protein
MFEQMVSTLRNGRLPETNLLRKRFDAALIKKMAVIRTPYSFWPTDTKINPPAKQLLWAAILLHDKENFSIVEAIVATELEEKQRTKGQSDSIQDLAAKVRQLLQAYIREFIDLAPDEICRENLSHRAQELFPILE